MSASRLHRYWQLVRHFGPKWLMYRAWYAVRLKSGLMRSQLPVCRWDDVPLARFLNGTLIAVPEKYLALRYSASTRFFFDPNDVARFRSVFDKWDGGQLSTVQAADDVGRGVIPFFSHERVHVGCPPDWHTDPLTKRTLPHDLHWSQIGDFAAGDIKLVWETNRFTFVFSLVRAYWRTGDEQYAELFWQLVESWYQSNPPQAGSNWKCGQEISLRVMAWCFGLYGFGASPSSTPARVAMLAQAIAVSGQRIESNIGYALSQQNNHGLSEAMGLWTIGSLFPEFNDSSRWEARGRQLLERQSTELIYDDGSFSQHSMNYHRVMLHDYLWSIRLGDLLNRPFSNELKDRIAKAGEFVYQLQDDATGRVPCYGQDDGALILPLNNCDSRDYRPVVQSISLLTSGSPRLQSGPWDEDLFWLFGINSSSQNVREAADPSPQLKHEQPKHEVNSHHDFDAPVGGYFTMRSQSGCAVTRAAGFRHRPAQADMLHVDLWWRGENIAIDPGTYSYNSPAPWNNPFAHTAYHNTVTVDDCDQMDRVSRFVWLPWLTGKSFGRDVSCQGDASCWNGEHDGYQRLSDPVTHRRGIVRLGDEHWLIVDALRGLQSHNYRLHWLLLDAPYQLDDEAAVIELQTSAGRYRVALTSNVPTSQFDVTRASPDSAVGWRSCYYHSREAALSIGFETSAVAVVFATLLGPDAQTPAIQQDRVQVCYGDCQAEIALDLAAMRGSPLITSVVVDDSSINPTASTPHSSRRIRTESRPCTYY